MSEENNEKLKLTTDKKEISDTQQLVVNKIDLDVHRAIVMWLFLATLTLTLFLASTLIYSSYTGKEVLTALPVVILAGVLGAFVSALNRIYSASDIFPVGKNTPHY
jgi:hypothetical protein